MPKLWFFHLFAKLLFLGPWDHKKSAFKFPKCSVEFIFLATGLRFCPTLVTGAYKWFSWVIIWLGLLPARRQILERRSCRVPCTVCRVSELSELSELSGFNKEQLYPYHNTGKQPQSISWRTIGSKNCVLYLLENKRPHLFSKRVRHRRLFFNRSLFLNRQPLKKHISGSIRLTKMVHLSKFAAVCKEFW